MEEEPPGQKGRGLGVGGQLVTLGQNPDLGGPPSRAHKHPGGERTSDANTGPNSLHVRTCRGTQPHGHRVTGTRRPQWLAVFPPCAHEFRFRLAWAPLKAAWRLSLSQ